MPRIWKIRHRPMKYRSLQHFRWVRTWSRPIRHLPMVLLRSVTSSSITSGACLCPALGVTCNFDRKRLGVVSSTSKQSSPFTVLSLRLAPLYLWFGILSFQRHKEERFMFPVCPLLCFNAAVVSYLMRGWLEVAFVKVTNSPYRVSYLNFVPALITLNHRRLNPFFRNFTFLVVVTSALISVSRI